MKTFAQWLIENDNPHTEKRYSGNVTAVCVHYLYNDQRIGLWSLSDYFVEAVCGPYICLMPRCPRAQLRDKAEWAMGVDWASMRRVRGSGGFQWPDRVSGIDTRNIRVS